MIDWYAGLFKASETNILDPRRINCCKANDVRRFIRTRI